MKVNKFGGWRYQAVYKERETESNEKTREYTMCEVYLCKDGMLEAWTECASIAPNGETINELSNDIQYMLDDLRKWSAVDVESLYVGMKFRECVYNTEQGA